MGDIHLLIQDLIEKTGNINSIEVSDIPNIDLYMDQVTSFMDNYLSQIKRNDKDKILTKTMINNYTKDKLIPPPNKKKYSKEHMILLIFIAYFKRCISINDIKALLNKTSKYLENDSDMDLFNLYNIFLDFNKDIQNNFENDIKEKIDKINMRSNNETNKHINLFILVLSLISEADRYKFLAEMIIDKYFMETPK